MGVDVRVLVSVYHKPGFIPCPGLLKPVPSEKMGGGNRTQVSESKKITCTNYSTKMCTNHTLVYMY